MNKWKELCRLLQPLLGNDVSEAVFQASFVLHLKGIFGWDEASIEEQRRIQIGATDKRMDIVLSGIDFGIVMEMKRPCDRRDSGDVEQLKSYLLMIDDDKYKYGLLVGKEVTVVYRDKATNRKPMEIITFCFDSNNPEGIALGEILDKNVCSNEKLKKYVDKILEKKAREEEEIAKQEELKRLREKLRSELLENNGEMIKSMLKEWLNSDEYTEEMLDDILDGIEIRPKGIQGIGGGGTPPPFNTITEFKERCIIIKIKEENIWNKNGSSDEKLYETVRRCWRNKISSVERAEYVLAVVKGIVRGVYRPTRWYKVKQPECMICPVGENDRPCGRIAFEGEKAGEDIQNKYLHKDIPVEFKKPGMALPVLFTF